MVHREEGGDAVTAPRRCRRCGGLLRLDADLSALVCWACGRVANPPTIVPDKRWPGGLQPPPRPPSPKSGNPQAVFPPAPSHPWREESGAHWANTEAAQLTLAALRRRQKAMGRKSKGKQRVAPVGGLGI